MTKTKTKNIIVMRILTQLLSALNRFTVLSLKAKWVARMNSLQGFIVRNPNGIVFAAFVDRGLAVVFCHAQGYPEKWIESAEIIIRKIGVR